MFFCAHSTASDEAMWRTAAFEALYGDCGCGMSVRSKERVNIRSPRRTRSETQQRTDAGARHGTDEDDRARLAAAHHVLGGLTRAVERALDVDAHQLAELVRRVLGRREVLCANGRISSSRLASGASSRAQPHRRYRQR